MFYKLLDRAFDWLWIQLTKRTHNPGLPKLGGYARVRLKCNTVPYSPLRLICHPVRITEEAIFPPSGHHMEKHLAKIICMVTGQSLWVDMKDLRAITQEEAEECTAMYLLAHLDEVKIPSSQERSSSS